MKVLLLLVAVPNGAGVSRATQAAISPSPAKSAAFMGVWMAPGAIAFARMPNLA